MSIPMGSVFRSWVGRGPYDQAERRLVRAVAPGAHAVSVGG